MRIFYFGRVAEAAGRRQAEVDPPPDVRTAHALRAWIGRDDPALRDLLAGSSVKMAVNDEILIGDGAVAPGDEIAFMPPVSGG